MKITLWDIKGFGKFNQSKVTPGEGFNIVYAPNESGKSTLQAFIRAMFYGQKGGRKSKDGSLPPAKQYKPWNSDQYAGVLEYTLDDGASFRVGRNFEKGTANIYDGVSNNLTMNFPQDKDIGPKFAEEHLGLDETAFEKSIFIRQMQSAVDDEGRKNLVEKLSNLNTTGSEDLSLTRAVSALENALLERVGTGRSTTRPLDKVNIRILELEQKKQALLSLNEKYLNTRLDLHDKKRQQNEISFRLDQKKQQKQALRRQRLEAIKEELVLLHAESRALDNALYGCQQDMLRLKDFESVAEDAGFRATLLLHDIEQSHHALEIEFARMTELGNKEKALRSHMDTDEVFRLKVEKVEESLKKNSPAKDRGNAARKPQSRRIAALIAGLLALAMLGLHFALTSYVFLGLGIVFAVVLGIMLALPGKESVPVVDMMHQILLAAGFSDMSGFLEYKEAQLKYRSESDQALNQLQECRKRLEEIRLKAEASKHQLEALLEQAGQGDAMGEAAAAVASLKAGIEHLKKNKENERTLQAKRKSLEDQCKFKFLEAGNLAGKAIASIDELEQALTEFAPSYKENLIGIHEAQLSSELAALEDQAKRLQLDITALNTRLEQAPAEGELSSVLEEISLLLEKKAELEMTGSSLALASQVLSEAAMNLQRDYIPEFNNEMSKFLEQITNGRYQKVHTNDALQVNLEVPETDELVHVSRLSGGTIDQVYLCMRLAAVRLLEREGEKLPLFLDEPFSQYDEDRVRAAFEMLRDMSDVRQIFFFTCREREFEIACSVFADTMTRIQL